MLILIDLENSPNFMKSRWLNVSFENCRLEAFVGSFSSHATKDLATLYPFVHTFHIVDSGHKDAVDHAISVRTGQWLSHLPGGGVCIVSRDRFAAALVDVLLQQTPENTSVKQFMNMDQCFDALINKD